MSEYQYYEFRAIDKPLDNDEIDELRSLSSRAEITSTSLTNEYNYGSFRGNPENLMSKYFDAFVYVANWGTHRLMFRFPRRLFDFQRAAAYCDGQALKIADKKDFVLLEFTSEEEGGSGWVDGKPWMRSLLSLRADLLCGDFRALYLGWLSSFESRGWYDVDELEKEADLEEPYVPPGLIKLSAPLQALADFLRLEDALIEAAATADNGEVSTEPSRDELARWLKKMPAAAKEAYLVRFLAAEGDELLRAELFQRYRAATTPKNKRSDQAKRRTVRQLLAARDALTEMQNRNTAKKSAKK
jgi:hypothetical protein